MSENQKSSCCDSMKDGNFDCKAMMKKMKTSGFDFSKMMAGCCGDDKDKSGGPKADGSSCCEPTGSGCC